MKFEMNKASWFFAGLFGGLAFAMLIGLLTILLGVK